MRKRLCVRGESPRAVGRPDSEGPARTVGSLSGEEDESLILELLGTLVENLGREESGGHGCKVTGFGCAEMRSDGFQAGSGAEHATIPLVRVGSREARCCSRAVRETCWTVATRIGREDDESALDAKIGVVGTNLGQHDKLRLGP